MAFPPLLSDGRDLQFAYRWLIQEGFTHFGPWHFIDDQFASDSFRAEFAKEVADPNPSPVKDFQAFAHHAACDDFAGFVIRDGRVTEGVLDVHLTWSGRVELTGWPSMTVYDDIWAWLAKSVIEEMRVVVDRLQAYQAGNPEV